MVSGAMWLLTWESRSLADSALEGEGESFLLEELIVRYLSVSVGISLVLGRNR